MNPFGQLKRLAQASYGLLVTADGGELSGCPQKLSPETAALAAPDHKLALQYQRTLSGEVQEVRFALPGDYRAHQRYVLRTTEHR